MSFVAAIAFKRSRAGEDIGRPRVTGDRFLAAAGLEEQFGGSEERRAVFLLSAARRREASRALSQVFFSISFVRRRKS